MRDTGGFRVTLRFVCGLNMCTMVPLSDTHTQGRDGRKVMNLFGQHTLKASAIQGNGSSGEWV